VKLVVTIPAFNEEKSIGEVIKEIPESIEGIDEIEVVVVDDGSTDATSKLAEKAGANEVVTVPQNIGLAQVFRKGLEIALDRGADVIVNIDADGQYDGGEIPKLVKPVLSSDADIVLGSRFAGEIEHMSPQKRIGNIIATKTTSFVAGRRISDAQTGFRAFTRDAALRINVLSNYTYVHETIIQAVYHGLSIVEVPVKFRKRADKSRLISNVFVYAKKAGATIIRSYLHHSPLKVFLMIGGTIFSLGLLAAFRVLARFLDTGGVSPYYPTTILAAILLIIGFQVMVLGMLADLLDSNRRIMEEILYKLKKG